MASIAIRSLPIIGSVPLPEVKPEPICMIIPPSAFLLDERVFASLGILKVAACLEKAGFHVDMLDTSGIANYIDVITDYLVSHPHIKVIGLTATTPQLPATVKIVQKIREINSNIKIVLGGTHITLVSAAVKSEKKRGVIGRARSAMTDLEKLFDVLVAGDGEFAIFAALDKDAPKLIDADDNRGPYFMNNLTYESSPYPARHLIDVSSYKYSIENHKATSLIAQLGCPYACSYCGGRTTKMLRVIRTRSIESIINEMKYLYNNYQFTGIMFMDDELNVNKSMIELMNGISDLQSEIGVDFRLRGFIKSELFTDEQAKAMYRAGFRWLLCGFEAASPRILTNINKKATVEDNNRVMEIARRNNLKVKALMSIGHAGESEESVQAVHDWLIKVQPDDFDCTVITTYPGTPYYDEAVEETDGIWTFTCKSTGDKLHAYEVDFMNTAEYYKGDPNGGYHSYVYTDYLSSEKLVEMRDWVERDAREKLNIPFYAGVSSIRYEHSMGQTSDLPPFILKRSKI